MLRILFFFLILLISENIMAQTPMMDMYMGEYEKGIGSVTYRKDLYRNPPFAQFPYLVVIGPKFKQCNPDGFPIKEEFQVLHEIAAKIENTISSHTRYEHAGSFIYQCERLSYFYVADTAKLQQKLAKCCAKKYANYRFYLHIKQDKQWETYLKFLYPTREILVFNNNAKTLIDLKLKGDKLNKPHVLTHKASFNRVIERDSFVRAMVMDGYKIVGLEKTKREDFAYRMIYSKEMMLDEKSINELTEKFIKACEPLAGDYEGWETDPIRE